MICSECFFHCCDEPIPRDSRLVLALKTLCGFSTGEIAHRLFTSEANVHKRLERARNRLRESLPDRETPPIEILAPRLPSVLAVLYYRGRALDAAPTEAVRDVLRRRLT
jgi:predicted RNA polymerase sigma factor